MYRVKSVFSKVIRKYQDARLRTKMQLLFSVILLVTILFTGAAYQQIYSAVLSRRVADMSARTLAAIGGSMDSLINMENSYSKIILASNDVQETLQNPKGLMDLSRMHSVNTVLTGQLEINTLASSVYLIDNQGNRYGVDKRGLKPLNIINSDITMLPWYEQVAQRRGGYVLVKNGGGVFLEQPKEEFISLIRIINNLQNFQPIGILMLNIPVSSFAQACLSGDYADETSILVCGEDDDILLSELRGNCAAEGRAEATIGLLLKATNGTIAIEGEEYLISKVKMESAPWYIFSMIPASSFRQGISVFSLITIGILAAAGLLLFLGAFFVSRSVTRPIDRLVKSMDAVEQGVFEKVDFPTGNDEIGQLKRRYNIMVERIGVLFQKTIEDQKLKRQAELNLLQAQIKPHFLYNTLDSIRSLSLTGRNRRVYYTVTALEKYYFLSLNNGREIITLREEVELVKNYLRIQRIRYGRLFRAIYSVDASLADCKILKLILQPLAENSLYHGLKPRGGSGVIHISVQRQEDRICIAIEDNGIGMAPEMQKALLSHEECEQNSFGLRGTMERLRIFYEGKSTVSIESIPNVGTRIELLIPVIEEGGAIDE